MRSYLEGIFGSTQPPVRKPSTRCSSSKLRIVPVRTPSPWLKKKIIELMPIASTPAPAPLSGVDNAKGMLVQVMGGIGRQRCARREFGEATWAVD